MGLIPKNPVFIPSSDLCPIGIKGLQSYESKLRSQFPGKYNDATIGGGFCQMWALFYLEMCFKYPSINGTKLIKTAVDEINNMGIEGFAKHIIQYTNGFNKVLQEYYKVNVNITSKKLVKDKELREQIRMAYNDLVKEYLTRNKPVLASSLSKQLVALKTAVDKKWNEWNELKGKRDAEKTKAGKTKIQKQMEKIEDRIKELNRAVLTLEANQDMEEDAVNKREIDEIEKRITSLIEKSNVGYKKQGSNFPSVSFNKLRTQLSDAYRNYSTIIQLNKDKLKLVNKQKASEYNDVQKKEDLHNTTNELLRAYGKIFDKRSLMYRTKGDKEKDEIEAQIHNDISKTHEIIDKINKIIEV